MLVCVYVHFLPFFQSPITKFLLSPLLHPLPLSPFFHGLRFSLAPHRKLKKRKKEIPPPCSYDFLPIIPVILSLLFYPPFMFWLLLFFPSFPSLLTHSRSSPFIPFHSLLLLLFHLSPFSMFSFSSISPSPTSYFGHFSFFQPSKLFHLFSLKRKANTRKNASYQGREGVKKKG